MTDGDEETSESALSGCGHVDAWGRLVGAAPYACVPGSVDYTTAGCVQRNARRARVCDSECRYKAFGACVCTPSCAGRVCGDDGCGGSCGTCTGGKSCNASGSCVLAPSGGGGSGGSGSSSGSSGSSGSGPPPPSSCTTNGSSCFVDGQCCSGNCYGGSATCLACLPSTTLAYCTKDSQCCSGLCDTWYVSCVSVCKHKTAACTSNSQCCSGSCKLGSCL